MTYKQLNKEQREVIQILINKKENFTTIGNSINVDRTTISKEIRRNRYIKSNYYEPFDFNGINNAENDCKILQHPPYVCNTCPLKNTCNKHKLYYDAKIAHEHYEELKSYSRSGIDITPETIEEIENSIVPLIKDKHQSINQIYANHDDLIYFSKPTFYKYIDMGVFSLTNLDLPKKVKYKKRSYMGRKHKYPIGYKFNKLTIIEHLGKINKNNHQYYYKCKCDCGNIITIISGNINKQKSCGCRIYKYPVGYKFNKLTIISTGNKIDNKPFRYYKCKCDCGNIIYIRSNAINTQKSCGCFTTKYNIRYSYKTKVEIKALVFLVFMDIYSHFPFWG